ncbi:MAG: hypothetical protein ABJN34_03255 [Litoreibacter sp.]|uniref:hypothetical protein n=1 Tax=Litoreibacter sp. TaxID=1969459 RepID=UPI003297ADB0
MPRKPNSRDSLPPNFNPETAPPSLAIDWDAYLPLLEDEDISDAEKEELIEALWYIVISFVDLGFGVHPVQQACGQGDDPLSDTPPDLLSLMKQNTYNQDDNEEERWP